VVDSYSMATVSAPRAISVSEVLLRREAAENAIADLRLEGLAPSENVLALLNKFIQGELTEEELVGAVIAR
jgi:Antitoxin VbhA